MFHHFDNLNASNVETYSIIHLLSLEKTEKVNSQMMQVKLLCHQCEKDFEKGMDLKRHNTLNPDTSMQS